MARKPRLRRGDYQAQVKLEEAQPGFVAPPFNLIHCPCGVMYNEFDAEVAVRHAGHVPVLQNDGKVYTKVLDEWLPIPAAVLAKLGWVEGTELELVPIYNNQLIVRKKGALSDADPTT